MFEVLINLMLAGLFMEAKVAEQTTAANLAGIEYSLPPAEMRESAPQIDAESPSVGVKITAQSALAIDEATGKILYQKNPGEVRSIASLTKLMTALVFLEHNPGWSTTVKVGSDDYQDGGINYLIAGEEISVNDIFYAMLVSSSNEAASALAKSTGLSDDDFVKAMNQKAQDLGLGHTHFTDMTGLSNNNQSTAAEVAILASAAFADPDISKATATKDYQLTIINKNIKRKITTTDKILGQSFGAGGESYQVLAGKTGYLEKAGYCFVSRIVGGQNQKALAVVLGSDTINSRFTDTKGLAYFVFNNYLWQ